MHQYIVLSILKGGHYLKEPAMENKPEINFVKEYKPATDAVVELTNARIADVMNGCFFDQKVSVLIRNGKIISMPGLDDETSGRSVDLSIDLQGKTMLPGLFNVHCHIQMINPTLFADFKTLKAKKRYHDQQVEKNMADCLACGITNIRDGVLTQKDIDACLNSDCIIEPTLSVGYDMSWRLGGNRFYNDPSLEKLYAFRNKTFADLVENFWVPELKECVFAGFNKANLGKDKMLGIVNLSKLLAHYCRLA
jgi:hypothetical protein